MKKINPREKLVRSRASVRSLAIDKLMMKVYANRSLWKRANVKREVTRVTENTDCQECSRSAYILLTSAPVFVRVTLQTAAILVVTVRFYSPARARHSTLDILRSLGSNSLALTSRFFQDERVSTFWTGIGETMAQVRVSILNRTRRTQLARSSENSFLYFVSFLTILFFLSFRTHSPDLIQFARTDFNTFSAALDFKEGPKLCR